MTKHDAMCGIPEIHGYDDYDCSCDFIQRIEKRTKERIIKLLEGDKRLHSYFYVEQFLKVGASVLPFVETHAKDCPGCDLIALIKGEK